MASLGQRGFFPQENTDGCGHLLANGELPTLEDGVQYKLLLRQYRWNQSHRE